MDNTVGSLTQLQKSIIIGCILGDGYLRIFPGRKNALLEINHSLKAKEYVDWKYSALKNVAGSPPKIRKGNGNRLAYRFYTKQLPELTNLLKEFYRNGKKIVPDNLILNPIILSVLLGLDTKLNKDKCYWRIRFLTSSLPKLRELIGDKIIPSMKYKIEL